MKPKYQTKGTIGCVDLSFGGGVIEHFKNTQIVIDHLYRVTKENGIAYNTVPYLNVGNLIYRSKWSGIPNIPVLREMLEFFHRRVLGDKHMVFGYELQFTKRQLRKLHRRSGFDRERIAVDRHHLDIQLHAVRNPRLRKFLIGLSEKTMLLYPAVKVVAQKS